MTLKHLYVIIFLNSVFYQIILSQNNYGLQFYAHEEPLDNRTSLNLNPNSKFNIKGDFELNFELAIPKKQTGFFGYILRIVGNDTSNLDLLLSDLENIVLLDGKTEKSVSIPVNINDLDLYQNLSIKLDKEKNQIILSFLNQVDTLNTDSYKNIDEWEVFFGINRHNLFRTTDVPNMQLRNIELNINQRSAHFWPLDNLQDSIIKDEIGHQDAIVENPLWVYQLYDSWKKEYEFTIHGYSQFVREGMTDNILFLSSDTLVKYNLWGYESISRQPLMNKIFFPNGSKIAYNPFPKNILFYSIDYESYGRLSLKDLSSNKNLKRKGKSLTAYWQHNRFFNPHDTSLIFFGGYGYVEYKNDIIKLNLNNPRWTKQTPDKKLFNPRYLSALGANKTQDTVYILGGYGNESGDQKLNPRYIYDLHMFIPKENEIKKVYTIKDPKLTDFCLSSSMVLTDNDTIYYALAYSKYEYKNELRLIRGSINRPSVQIDNSSIPFLFHDTRSYIDLFYSSEQEKLFAVTLYYDEIKNQSTVKIYSIPFEPILQSQPVKTVKTKSNWHFTWIIGIIIVLILLFKFIPKKKKTKSIEDSNVIIDKSKTISETDTEKISETKITQDASDNINLFGDFKVIDSEDNIITGKFTPLLKELFLLLFLKSTGPSPTGISSEQLIEILWFDKSEKDARNNRAVNIARMKTLLSSIGDIELSKETGYWLLQVNDPNVKIDYLSFIEITQTSIHKKEQINNLLKIIRKGEFLINTTYDWLDKYKAEVTDKIIDILVHYAQNSNQEDDLGFLIDVSDTILLFDSVHEEALKIKCKSLVSIGKLSIAKTTFDMFLKEYEVIYGEKCVLSFNDVINN